jgi:hypothetical protein
MALAKAIQNLTGSACVRVCVLVPRDLCGPRKGCVEPDGLGMGARVCAGT